MFVEKSYFFQFHWKTHVFIVNMLLILYSIVYLHDFIAPLTIFLFGYFYFVYEPYRKQNVIEEERRYNFIESNPEVYESFQDITTFQWILGITIKFIYLTIFCYGIYQLNLHGYEFSANVLGLIAVILFVISIKTIFI
ncbi:hypothetical protein D3873_09000 [Paenisporosarcina cavernae]|uniref:Uncharacterized protein n=1 Tax=Paenisporosarcina cavernae TaxID=2320858 RepID=A0A385YU39_9BACL|nr:hypothetical protein D3873_09000 [Paenisporosarcina cavernae]